MPCSGERGPLVLRSASSARAVSSAFGIDGEHGPQRWSLAVVGIDARQEHLHQLLRGQRALSNAALTSAIVAASRSIVRCAETGTNTKKNCNDENREKSKTSCHGPTLYRIQAHPLLPRLSSNESSKAWTCRSGVQQ